MGKNHDQKNIVSMSLSQNRKQIKQKAEQTQMPISEQYSAPAPVVGDATNITEPICDIDKDCVAAG